MSALIRFAKLHRLTVVFVVAIAAVSVWIVATDPQARTDTTALLASINRHQPGLYRVVEVADGDTIMVRAGNGPVETVRMLGIDTPEVKDPRKPVQCYGTEASHHTKERIKIGDGVRLSPDPDDTDRDKYGRLLRYVYLTDGTLYNAELVREGYAFAYRPFALSRLDEFIALETAARTMSKGVWSACQIDESSLIKQTNAIN